MSNDSYVLSLIRRHVRLFTILLFVASALLFLILVMLRENYEPADGTNKAWWDLLLEIPKGILAASAVAFLFDWVLKRENEEQVRRSIRAELREAREAETIDSETAIDFSMEFVYSPVDDFSLESTTRFCRLGIQQRYWAYYAGDEVVFSLVVNSDSASRFRDVPTCLFYWILDECPASAPDENWFKVMVCKVDGKQWEVKEVTVDPDFIACKFQRPAVCPSSHGKLVSYEFDIRTIDTCPSPMNLNYSIERPVLRSTWRLDARQLGAKSAKVKLTPHYPKALHSQYVNTPEGAGTCQAYVSDLLATGGSVHFTVVGVG